ncbi:alpha/beta hydrolase family protein [Lichenicoccus sp.]|uniref:alpha/beta hydrolase family protein n=1 Tax=Lichenicoccus sp. TaxID=2781899 RepID=UPI003D117570
MARPTLAAALPLAACLLAGVAQAQTAPQRAVRLFDDLALAPDGAHVASIEHDQPAHDGDEPVKMLVIRPTGGGNAVTVALPCARGPDCKPIDPVFSPDGTHAAFVLQRPKDTKRYIEEVGVDGSGLVQRLAFDGQLGGLHFGPEGQLAVLAIAGARKKAGAVQAGAPLSGEIGVSSDEQRIAVLSASGLRFVSPPNLYVYEYDWRRGAGFVGTAAPGNGDNQWWVAKLWDFPLHGAARVLYAPPRERQLADPTVSPDGAAVAFIGGIMSDFGSTGGDAYRLALTQGAHPVDLTLGIKASVTSLNWRGADGLVATALAGSDTELLALGAHTRRLWSGADWLNAGGWNLSALFAGSNSVTVHQSFTRPPEIEAGPIGHWHDLTSVNRGLTVAARARSLTWHSDGYDVQGWLLSPDNGDAHKPRAMITNVHGGPSAATTPAFLTESRGLWLLRAGYDVFLPNPRGSFGQGEAFARANVRDFGHGDLRDILRGVDAAIAAAPVDPRRLGLTGYSYGGYMTMWAVTQTHRFKAAVAGAGVSDWLSYYGENGIDQWMIPFFGASVYDDPAVYAKSSPINSIKAVRTPTFVYVGSRDLECPLPQSEEFWHALRTLGVPTEFVVYPGQGHALENAADRADAKRRTLAWFARWLGTAKGDAAGG